MSETVTEKSGLEAIRLSQKQAKVLSSLLRLPPKMPVESLTRLTLQDPSFCDRMLTILFPRRRPPSITAPVIHQCVRQLGADRVRQLFVCNCIIKAFEKVRLPDFKKELFWLESIRRGFIAQQIAEETGYRDPYEAFLAGLFSELGSLLFAARFLSLSGNIYALRGRQLRTRSKVFKILLGQNQYSELAKSGFSKLVPPRIMQAITAQLEPFPKADRQSQLTCILHASNSLGDIGQATPKAGVLEGIESGLELFDPDDLEKPLDAEELFTAAESQANSMAQDLGLDVPYPKEYHALLEPIAPPVVDIDPMMPGFSLSNERLLDDRNTFNERVGRALEDRFEEEFFTVLMVDIDHFTKLNSSYGFPTGDNLLRIVSQLIARSMRNADVVAHLGEDKFALFLPDTQATGGRIAAERVRALVKQGNITLGTLRINSSVSIGGITVDDLHPFTDSEELWKSLRQVVEGAKETGRNRVAWHR
jgi:diguanylate cyclase (GGDEF)-like protein